MDAVIDSSSLISLARAGLLPLLRQPFVQPIILDAVRIETVDAGLAGSHPDAVAIEAATVAGRSGRPLLVSPRSTPWSSRRPVRSACSWPTIRRSVGELEVWGCGGCERRIWSCSWCEPSTFQVRMVVVP
jgi:hypothetical protein